MSEAISPQQADGTARRIEVIRQTASHGDPYEIRFTRYAAQLMLGEIDRMAKELAHYIQAESADAAAGSYALRAETAEAERDRLAARVAELEGEREHFRSQLNDDMDRETKLVVERAEAAIAIDDLSAEVVRLARELAEARGMARYAYQRWPAPIFWHAAARRDSPYTALPDWLTEPQPAAAPDRAEGSQQ